jgi:hypothetical protein
MMWPPRAGAERSAGGKKMCCDLHTQWRFTPSTEQKIPGRVTRSREVVTRRFLVFRSGS